MKRAFGILLLLALIVSACASVVTPAAPVPTEIAQTLPTAIPATSTPEPVTLTVLAASSLTNAFKDAGTAFQAANPNVTVTFSFAGSQQLAQQINSGAPADVFASANTTQMDAVVKGGRVVQADVSKFAGNSLVVVVPTNSKITSLTDLVKSEVKIVLAAKEVPVGQYALTMLDKLAADSSFGMSFKTAFLANVVSYEQNVNAVLTKVELGEGDAGVVYSTDAASAQGKVVTLPIPNADNVPATYPIAVLSDSPNLAAARGFVAFVLSSDGQAIMAKYGFQPPVK